MGGVPRRRACKQCSIRRVKCDESRPSCATCIRLHLTCPGYEEGVLTWRSENIRLCKKHGKLHISGRQTSSVAPSFTIIPTIPYHLFRIVHLHPFANSHISPSATSSIRSLDPKLFAGLKPNGFESYISFIPSRLGYNSALDAAVECLTTLYSDFLISSKTDSQHRAKYAQALSCLRACLQDRTLALASETLCATLLLGIYEVLANQGESSMLRHIHGASDLIRARGPERHVEPFERAMLLAAQGPLSNESVATGFASLLDSPTWIDLISVVPLESSLEEDQHCQKLKFLDGFSIPTLIRNFLNILHSEQLDVSQVTVILCQAIRFRVRFLKWAEATTPCEQRETRLIPDRQSFPGKRELLPTAQLLKSALASKLASCSLLDVGAYGEYYGLLIIINRVILCLREFHPLVRLPASEELRMNSPASLATLEEENRQLANMAFETETYLRSNRPFCLLYYRFSLHVAKATLSTSDEWTESHKPGLSADQSGSSQNLIFTQDGHNGEVEGHWERKSFLLRERYRLGKFLNLIREMSCV